MQHLADTLPDLPSNKVPSWVMSVVFHALLLILLGWLIRPDARTVGLVVEPGRETGIVLKRVTESGEFYEGENSTDQAETTHTQNANSSVAEGIPADTEQFTSSEALPAKTALGAGAIEDGGVSGAGELTAGEGQPRTLKGGNTKVNVYGAEAEGSKFVFVFDRSVSMDGEPLASAKKELLQGIAGLKSTHQFQIIFFNHEPRIFDLSGQGRIPFATDRIKQQAANFIGGITADGNTDRMKALEKALVMSPDVIFFLTDADNPMLPAELEAIRRNNKGHASIQTIEFGYGPNPGGSNFLTKLAAQNAGTYVYVDTSLLER